ncbi:hypothetical protein PUN28_016866 [Cardiocondyla obscurior]|uniref:Uncharacterized protein n=1 Tax=Cardiocondyla obscurior TaxID=286306 RepID=A0AAW2ESY0_9HYME
MLQLDLPNQNTARRQQQLRNGKIVGVVKASGLVLTPMPRWRRNESAYYNVDDATQRAARSELCRGTRVLLLLSQHGRVHQVHQLILQNTETPIGTPTPLAHGSTLRREETEGERRERGYFNGAESVAAERKCTEASVEA